MPRDLQDPADTDRAERVEARPSTSSGRTARAQLLRGAEGARIFGGGLGVVTGLMYWDAHSGIASL
jgi:hypothetical protein